jgi:hypothetical protein
MSIWSNFVGRFMGIKDCPVTHNNLYGHDIVEIPFYKESYPESNTSTFVSAESFRDFGYDEIAKVVYGEAEKQGIREISYSDLEERTKNIYLEVISFMYHRDLFLEDGKERPQNYHIWRKKN